MNSSHCVFFHNKTCDHTGVTCNTCCDEHLSEISLLTYRDHFEIFEKRRYEKKQLRLNKITITISIIALIISITSAVGQVVVDVFDSIHEAQVNEELLTPGQ